MLNEHGWETERVETVPKFGMNWKRVRWKRFHELLTTWKNHYLMIQAQSFAYAGMRPPFA